MFRKPEAKERGDASQGPRRRHRDGGMGGAGRGYSTVIKPGSQKNRAPNPESPIPLN